MSFKRKEINYESHFKQIQETLSSLFYHSTNKTISGLEIYYLIYEMCNAKPKSFTDRLFCDIASFIDKYLLETCQSIITQSNSLSMYAKRYESFERAMRNTDILCDYLNRMISGPDASPYIVGKYKKQPIYTLGLYLWKRNVLINIKEKYNDRLFKQWFEVYQNENQIGEYATSIRKLIDSLIDVNAYTDQRFQLYIEYFETPFKEKIKLFHEKRAAKDNTSGDMMTFMEKATFSIEEESLKAQYYAHTTSYNIIMNIIETQYITRYSHAILESFKEMLKSNNENGCKLAYGLLSRTPDGLNSLVTLYYNHVLKLGKNVLKELFQQQQTQLKSISLYYVESLLGLYDYYNYFNKHIFFSNSQFQEALDKAFHAIMNESTNYKSADVLAYYTDLLLKKSSSKLYLGSTFKYGFISQHEEEKYDQNRVFKTITLFKYLNDKDIFQKHYQKLLAKRLVYNTYHSIDNEAQMIQLFKQVCGSEYTTKFYKMLSDKELSKDLTLEYNNYKKKQGMDLDAQILTSSAWPFHQEHLDNSNIPVEFMEETTKFKSFYDKKYNGRKLIWQRHLSRVDIRLLYLSKPYELQMSFYQSIILLLFNYKDDLSFSYLVEETGLNKEAFLQHIKPILESRILTYTSDEIHGDSVFTINTLFKSKRFKIKLSSTVIAKSNVEETITTNIDADRHIYLQAAIIRIMKSRQNSDHIDLIRQVMEQQNQLRFKPTVPLIKKCIEQLIEKEFIRRKENNVYEYIA